MLLCYKEALADECFVLKTLCVVSRAGVLLAVLETLEIISPIYGPDGSPSTNAGTVSAGYQNFLVFLSANESSQFFYWFFHCIFK